MKADRDPVERLLESVADGIPVDWDGAALGSVPAERPRIEALRAISRIAQFSRAAQRAGGDAPFPERWGGLLLLERLGGGSQADVFRAWDPELRREVALKLLRADAAGPGDDALIAEGRAAAAIRHANVVTVYGVERHEGRVGLSMELLRGATLEQEVFANGPLEPAAAARLAAEIGAALAAVHEAGLVHRDLKPANVVRAEGGRFVLADFGLGLRAATAAAAGAPGTPMYMAPETLAGGPASPRSDVYALGLLTWFALAGRHPFAVTTLDELRAAAAAGPAPRLRELQPGIPPRLAAAIERVLAASPDARPAGAREFAAEVAAAAAASRPPSGRRAAPGLAAAMAGLLALVAVFALARRPREAAVSVVAPATPSSAAGAYDVEATFVRHAGEGASRLAGGDRVRPGDRLTLELRATRSVWVYVLNEDERGEQYLLFPQPRFDLRNPLAADSAVALPGTIGGRPNAWTVTSAGGREHFLVVASPEPVAELEADLARLPAARPGAPITYAPVGRASAERLRGVGGVAELPAPAAASGARTSTFSRFRSLATAERGVTGVWVRQVTLENPRHE